MVTETEKQPVALDERPRMTTVRLGEQEVVITRLRTRDGLNVARIIIRYVSELREPIANAMQDREIKDLTNVDQEEGLRVATEMLDAVNRVIRDDDFLKMVCSLIGQPAEVVGDAPIEDTMNAMADALAINDMPALMKAAGRIFQEVGKLMEGLR